MKKLKLKLIEKLKQYMPITRKVYERDLRDLTITIEGLTQNEAQHSQMEMNIIQKLNSVKSEVPEKKKENKSSSFYA